MSEKRRKKQADIHPSPFLSLRPVRFEKAGSVIGMSEKEPKTSLTLYIPISVKKKLEEKAKEKGMSISQFICFLVEEKPSS